MSHYHDSDDLKALGEFPPHVAEVVRHLPPEIKQAVKAALRSIAIEPATGEPLRGAVGHRRGIYEEVSGRLPRPPA